MSISTQKRTLSSSLLFAAHLRSSSCGLCHAEDELQRGVGRLCRPLAGFALLMSAFALTGSGVIKAGDEGIEPSTSLLEREIIPFN